MGIFVVVFLAIAVLIAFALPEIGKKIASGLGIGTLNVHVPLFVNENNSLMAHDTDPTLGSWSGVETTMGALYGTFQSAGLACMVIALIFAGLYFTLEPIGLVREGTAFSILSGSLVTLLLLALFPVFYNAAARTLNYFNEDVVLQGDMTNKVGRIAEAACTPTLGLSGFADIIARFIFGAMSIMVVFGAGVIGAMRILMLGIFATVFPLFIVLRLIPFLKHASDTVVTTVIGMMLGSILAAAFFRFGFDVISSPSMSGGGNIGPWIAGTGVLAAMAMLPSMLAPSLGRMLMRAGSMTTVAVGSAVAGVTAAAGGVGGGLLAGGAGGLTHVTGLKPGAGIKAQAGARFKDMAIGAGAGAKGGLGKPGSGGVLAGYGTGHGAVDRHVTEKVIPEQFGIGQAATTMDAFNSRFNKPILLGGRTGTVKGIPGVEEKNPGTFQINAEQGAHKVEAWGGSSFKNLRDKNEGFDLWYATVHGGRATGGTRKHAMKTWEAHGGLEETRGVISDQYQRLVGEKGEGTARANAYINYLAQGGKLSRPGLRETLGPKKAANAGRGDGRSKYYT